MDETCQNALTIVCQTRVFCMNYLHPNQRLLSVVTYRFSVTEEVERYIVDIPPPHPFNSITSYLPRSDRNSIPPVKWRHCWWSESELGAQMF